MQNCFLAYGGAVVIRKLFNVTAVLGIISGLFSVGVEASASPVRPQSEIHQCIIPHEAHLCSDVTATVHIRQDSNTQSAILGTLYAGGRVILACYSIGESVNGDNIWYLGGGPEDGDIITQYVFGYVAGYYVNTGADPAPGVPRC